MKHSLFDLPFKRFISPFTRYAAAFALTVSSALMITPLTEVKAQSDASSIINDQNKEELGNFIKEYLLSNPEVVREALEEYSRLEELKKSETVVAAIAEQKEAIFNSVNGVIVGNPLGDVSIVEFFDYNCGYCRRSASDLTDLIEGDPNLRVVLKEFPILGQGSVEAAEVAIAVAEIRPDLYFDLHLALMALEGQADGAAARKIAGKLGVDKKELKRILNDGLSPEVLQESYMLAGILGINGTPGYVIGDEVVAGAIGVAGLRAKIENVRNCGKTRCA